MLQFVFSVLLLVSVVSVQASPNYDIENVHIIFSNHLDVGFSSSAIDIINIYFSNYFPAAVTIAKQLPKYIFTTHAWLVTLYLDCNNNTSIFPGGALKCPSASDLQSFVDTINKGQITWHGYPFNAQLSFMDASFIQAGVSIVHDLDARFKLPPKKTLSQRDVPGFSLGAVDALNKAGITAVSVGVNGGSAPPDVPKVFVWKNPQTGASVIAMWNPGGYGDTSKSDWVTVPGWTEALIFAWRSDNTGPGDVNGVKSVFNDITKQFPNANVFGSTFDNFVEKLQTVSSQLPVVTSEIGDSWMYGVPSDPWKVQVWREVSRIHNQYIKDKKSSFSALSQFYMLMLKVTEHTWGRDVKTFLHDTTNWSNVDFQKSRKNSTFLAMENSWNEQREYFSDAIKVLGNDPLAQEITNALNALRITKPPTLSGYTQVQNWNPTMTFSCGDLTFSFGENGGLSSLKDTKTNKVWATSDHVLGEYVYTTFDSTDYKSFTGQYCYCAASICDSWIGLDFGKPNVDIAKPVRGTWMGKATSLYTSQDSSICSYYLQIVPSMNLHTDYGAPSSIWIRTNFSKTESITIPMDFFVFDKTPTRLPEAHWIGFRPFTQTLDNELLTTKNTHNELAGPWWVDKCGQPIDPSNVVKNGSMHLHGQYNGVMFKSNMKTVLVEGLDVALVSLGAPDPFPTPFALGDPNNGLYFNFYNNIWGTNYVMWYPWIDDDANALYRFRLTLQ